MEADDERREGAGAGARPLVALACALGLGTELGLVAAEGHGWTAGAAALALSAAGLGLGARAGVPPWATWILLLAFGRASARHEPRPELAPGTAVAARAWRAEPIVGRWRRRDGGRMGWVEPFDGEDRRAGHALLLEPELVPPRDGTPVVILPGSEVSPWPLGPCAAAGSRARGFRAWSPVAADELVRLGPAPRFPGARALDGWLGALADLRETLGERAASVEGPRSAGLLRALAIGSRDGLAPERADLFARTGTRHLLALSGWHVGLFAVLFVLPLARRTPRGLASLLLRVGLVSLFAVLAGAQTPVLRATLAFVLQQLAALRGRGSRAPPRRPDAASFLGAAFALECLADPAGIRAPALVLSYAATLGLVLGTGPIAEALRPERAAWAGLAPPGPAGLVLARLAAWVRRGLAASLAAVLATLPFVWSLFGELAPAGAGLTVLVVVPFAGLSMLAWSAALVPWSGWRPPAELLARGLYGLLALGDALPGSPWLLPPRPFAALWLATALAFVALRRPWARRPAALAWGLLLLPWSAAPSGLELVALDVGHGTAVVARAPGLEGLVFDAGSRDRRAVASQALLPLLARWEAARVTVVLSHDDLDHASGLARLALRVPVERWLGAAPASAGPEGGPPSGVGPAQGIVRAPHARRGRWLAPSEGGAGPGPHPWDRRLDLAPGRLEVRGDAAELRLALLRGSAQGGNEGSRALELAWHGQRLLLLGDAEETGLTNLAVAPGPLRLLLAPHHGSQAGGLRELLERTPPREVWISAAGPPAIAGELTRRGLAWRWTGRDGPLALRLP